MIINLNNENFDEEIKNGLVLVDFYATWCGPCKMMHPVIDELATNHPELKIIKIDVDNHNELARTYGVMSIPTLIMFKNGLVVEKNIGFTPNDILENWITNNK